MPEFELIRRLQEIIDLPAAHGPSGCVIGIGDDAAVLDVPAGRQLAVCTDTLVEGVHFAAGTDPRAIGHKSLAVNLSDLAAMGAEPAWFFLALTLPRDDSDWLEAFAHGMADLARETGVVLAGGDTTSGGLSVTVTAVGFVPPGRALTRGGARPGDRIVVSGEPGRAARALRQFKGGIEPDRECIAALEYPVPRLALGEALHGLATSCIDLSDGLAADLGHILARSGVGAVLDLGGLPRPRCLAGLDDEDAWALQLAGGDDYELCFTVPAGRVKRVAPLARELGVRLSPIGEITAETGLLLRRPGGEAFEVGVTGYEHFAARPGQGGMP